MVVITPTRAIRSAVAIVILSFAFAASARADVKEDVVAAAQKLADSESYSWTTTAEGAGGAGAGGAEGKTQKGGLTVLTLNLRDAQATVIFKGEKGAYHTEAEGWQSVPAAGAGAGAGGGGGGGAAAAGGGARQPAQVIANLIRTYRPPAAQALNLAGKAQDLKQADDGCFTGTLGAEDAKSLLQRRGGRRGGGAGDGAGDGAGAGAGAGGPEIRDAAATVTFWTKDGVLTKYRFNVQGVMTVQGEDRQINRTTTVEIKDVGATKIEVPEEAKAKMG